MSSKGLSRLLAAALTVGLAASSLALPTLPRPEAVPQAEACCKDASCGHACCRLARKGIRVAHAARHAGGHGPAVRAAGGCPEDCCDTPSLLSSQLHALPAETHRAGAPDPGPVGPPGCEASVPAADPWHPDAPRGPPAA